MISKNEAICPVCGGELKYYDRVRRIVRSRYGKVNYIWVRRFKCLSCDKTHREIPETILPYKQFESEIIFGVREGLINSNVLGFEDNPSEDTMRRWLLE